MALQVGISLFGLQIDGGWVDEFSYLTAVAWSWARYVKRVCLPTRCSFECGRGHRAAFDAREFLAKLRREESRGAERMKKGKAEGEEAQTKKACRFGKPLMLFDVSYLVAGVGFEPTTFGL